MISGQARQENQIQFFLSLSWRSWRAWRDTVFSFALVVGIPVPSMHHDVNLGNERLSAEIDAIAYGDREL
jgi:hypothetical protein